MQEFSLCIFFLITVTLELQLSLLLPIDTYIWTLMQEDGADDIKEAPKAEEGQQ